MTEFEPADFDPTEEGKQDINDTIDEDYEDLLPRGNESNESWWSRFKQKFGRGSRYAFSRFKDIYKTKNSTESLPEYMKFEEIEMGEMPYDMDLQKRLDDLRKSDNRPALEEYERKMK